MVEFINTATGGKMLVAEDRVEEYKAAGHKLVSDVSPKKPAAKPKEAKKGKTKK